MVESEQQRNILDKLLTEAFFRPERLPGLHAVYEKAALECSDQIEPFAATPFTITFSGVRNSVAGQMLAPVDDGRVFTVVTAPNWDEPALILLDSNAVAIIVELLLGSDGSEPPVMPIPSVSNVTLKIVTKLLDTMCVSLRGAFAPFFDANLSVEEVTMKIQPDRLGVPQTPVVVADYKVNAFDVEGTLSVVTMRSLLSPLRVEFEKTGVGEGVSSPGWTQQLESEITKTSVTLTAVLDEGTATLAEVAGLRVGQVVPLSFTPDSRVRVQVNNEPILLCHFGHVDGAYTLQLDEFVDQQKEFIDGILPN